MDETKSESSSGEFGELIDECDTMLSLDELYQDVLEQVIQLIGHDSTTTDYELERVCEKLFGAPFVGVFPSDKAPKLKDGEMCIINLDPSTKPGSHWVALMREDGKHYFYDSFGRAPKKIISPLLRSSETMKAGGLIFDTEDGEQSDDETNCGLRCIAFLVIGFVLGGCIAAKI